jgi:hypothetical protein
MPVPGRAQNDIAVSEFHNGATITLACTRASGDDQCLSERRGGLGDAGAGLKGDVGSHGHERAAVGV